jgi:hypothetical protein
MGLEAWQCVFCCQARVETFAQTYDRRFQEDFSTVQQQKDSAVCTELERLCSGPQCGVPLL